MFNTQWSCACVWLLEMVWETNVDSNLFSVVMLCAKMDCYFPKKNECKWTFLIYLFSLIKVLVIVVRNRGHKASDHKGQAFWWHPGWLWCPNERAELRSFLFLACLTQVDVELYITIPQPDHKYKNNTLHHYSSWVKSISGLDSYLGPWALELQIQALKLTVCTIAGPYHPKHPWMHMWCATWGTHICVEILRWIVHLPI